MDSRTPAERSSITPAAAARSGGDRPHSQNGTEPISGLDAAAADRFALAFRPSWAPLEPELQPPAAQPAPIGGANASDGREAEPRELQEPLRVPVRGARRRASLLAGASVLSFLGLLYWGISSTTHPAAPVHVLQNGQRGLIGNAPAQPAHDGREPVASENAAPLPGDTATDLSALRARPELVEPSRARLADPDQPPAAPTAAEGQIAEADGTEPAPVAEAAESSDQAPAATAEPAAEPLKAGEPPRVADGSPQTAPATAEHATTASPPVASPEPIASAQHAEASPPVANPERIASAQHAPAPAASAAATQPTKQPTPAAPPTAAAKTGAVHQEPIATAARVQAEPAPQSKRMPLLSVRALPEGARLFLDGQRLPNPFDMRLPEGGKHKLEARYEGFESSTQTVRIEADAKLTITLRRTPTEPQLQVRPLGQQPAQRTQGAGFVTSNPY